MNNFDNQLTSLASPNDADKVRSTAENIKVTILASGNDCQLLHVQITKDGVERVS